MPWPSTPLALFAPSPVHPQVAPYLEVRATEGVEAAHWILRCTVQATATCFHREYSASGCLVGTHANSVSMHVESKYVVKT